MPNIKRNNPFRRSNTLMQHRCVLVQELRSKRKLYLKLIDTIYDTIIQYKGEKNLSQWDKLLKRVLNLSPDLRFEELRKILESYGYEMNTPRGGSSHYTFRKAGIPPITIPKHKPIKRVYIEMVREVVEREEAANANN